MRPLATIRGSSYCSQKNQNVAERLCHQKAVIKTQQRCVESEDNHVIPATLRTQHGEVGGHISVTPKI